ALALELRADADHLEVVDPGRAFVGENGVKEGAQADLQALERIRRNVLDCARDRLGDVLDVAVVDGAEQILPGLELLVEVAGVQSRRRAEGLDRCLGVAVGPEQLKAGVEQPLAALGTALLVGLAGVAPAGAGSTRRFWHELLTD